MTRKTTWLHNMRRFFRTAGAVVLVWLGTGMEVRSQSESSQGQPVYVDAAKWTRERAEQGDAEAQYKMGTIVAEDNEEAAKWLQKAAEQGHVKAQFRLGGMYARGDGVPQNHEEAVRWYRRAAELGYFVAQARLGWMYDRGEGVPQDHGEAMKWFRRVAERGHVAAQFRLGMMYVMGEGVRQDRGEARKWFRKAADLGHSSAQRNLGLMYHKGDGVPQDHEEAVAWYRRAAEQGHVGAQVLLGDMYYGGEGVLQDYGEALKWFRSAAEMEHDDAQYALGWMHHKGEGVGQDPVKGHAWFHLAAAGGDERAVKSRDDLAARMTPAQLAEAQALAAELLKLIEAMTVANEAVQNEYYRQSGTRAALGRHARQTAASVSGMGGAAESGPCEIPGYPSPANPQSLGLSWCPVSVTFQVRVYALAAAGSKCAVAKGNSSTPEQIQARRMEVEAYCEQLKAWPGNTRCLCPPGYSGGSPEDAVSEARRQDKAKRRQAAEEERRRSAEEEEERRRAAEEEEERRRAAERERLEIAEHNRDTLNSDCTCISIDTGKYLCMDGFVSAPDSTKPLCDIRR